MRDNPAGWPAEVLPVFERSVTCEFATLAKNGTPITYPLNPYIGEDQRTIDVTTGLSYPAKAERARRNPKVAMLFSDSVGSGLTNSPVVLVLGMAAVRDSDLQTNTDRYMNSALIKYSAAYNRMPAVLMRRSHWYFVRIWILVTPLRILWWPNGNLETPPQEWIAPTNISIRRSDVAPAGNQPRSWKEPPADWRENAHYSEHNLGTPVLSVVDAGGFPVPFRVNKASTASEGFWLDLPAGMPTEANGPACLTFHKHPEVFVGQENRVFVGSVEPSWQGAFFSVERQLPDFSLSVGRAAFIQTFLRAMWRLTPRLRAEVRRRGQPMPRIKPPKNW